MVVVFEFVAIIDQLLIAARLLLLRVLVRLLLHVDDHAALAWTVRSPVSAKKQLSASLVSFWI